MHLVSFSGTNPPQIDIFTKDIVIFPINHNNMHWACGAINIKDKRFEYYDSLSSEPDTHAFAVSHRSVSSGLVDIPIGHA